MSAEMLIAGTAVAGVLMVAVTQVRLIRKNGHDQAARDQKVEDSLLGVIRRLDDPHTGMGALNHKINEMQKKCSGVTSDFAARLKNIEKKSG